MIYPETKLTVADNSGAKYIKCIQVLNRQNYNVGSVGSVILLRVTKKNHSKKIKKKILYFGLVIMIKQYQTRNDGSVIKFTDNRVLLFSNAQKIIGSRIYSPIMVEVKTKLRTNKKEQQKYLKIFSYSTLLI
jgi:large subunit ribosomal protein L14